MTIAKCKECGKDFELLVSFHYALPQFCTVACRKEATRKQNRTYVRKKAKKRQEEDRLASERFYKELWGVK